MRTTSFHHPSLSIVAAITRKITSSFFASSFIILLVILSLHSFETKILSSVIDAKKEQLGSNRVHFTTHDNRSSRLLSKRRALCTGTTITATSTPNFNTQLAFRLDITTDQAPAEMSWVLSDAITNQVIHFVEEGDDAYSKPNSFYQQKIFLEDSTRGLCYRIQITIKQHDDTCCALDNGVYHVFYDDKLLMQGSSFGESEASVLFGDACTFFSQTSTSSSSLETSVLSGPPPLTSPKPPLSSTVTTSEFLPYLSSPSNKPSVESVTSSKPSLSILSNFPSVPSLSSSSLSVLVSSNKPDSSSSNISPTKVVSKSSRIQQRELLPMHQSSSTTSSATCSDPTRALFQLELIADRFPVETYWSLVDVKTDNYKVISEDKGTYKNSIGAYSLLEDRKYCIDRTKCYQFTIFDSYGDGICCKSGNGRYRIFYEDQLILEGGHFSFNETSSLFGDGCPSSLPSESPAPTLSSVPSSTIHPSSSPTSSVKPSSIPSVEGLPVELSGSPTTFSIPTSSPNQNIDLIVRDEYNRRYFPKEISIRPEGTFPYQPVPDCMSPIGRIGCIAIPTSFEAAPPPWVGTLHFMPPSCNKRKRECTVGIPIPRTTHTLGSALVSLSNDVFKEATLPGDDLSTRSVVVVDMNNDGMVDIIIGNRSRKNQLLINDGDGKFDENAVVNLPGGASATISIAVADMNNDGMLDIIIGNLGQNNQLLINTGNGVFDENVVEDLPGGALLTRSVAVADMNNDGMLDIIIGNSGQKNQILINAGDGTFDENAVLNLPGGTLTTMSVAVADVDNDGMVDIIIGNWGQYDQLLINMGDGTFDENAVEDLPGGASYTISIAVADMNNDGMLDIIVGVFAFQNKLLTNAGDGTFNENAVVNLPGGAFYTISIAVADMNNDGTLDIIIGNEGQYNQLLINMGDGTFDEIVADLPGGTLTTMSIAVADMNNDGFLDIIIGNRNENNQSLINAGGGTFSENAVVAVDLSGGDLTTVSIAVADMNNDGFLDIIIGNRFQKNQLLINSGIGTFSTATEDLPGGNLHAMSIAVADINNDDLLDIIIGNDGQYNQLLINAGDGTFDENAVVNLPGASTSKTYHVAVGDMNNDGMLDIIIGNRGKKNQLLINTGDGTFDENSVVNLPGGASTTMFIAVADMNNDGLLDIIISNSGQQNHLLINNGNGIFDENVVVNLPGGALETKSVAAADIDNDGMLDIIFGNDGQNNQLLINAGDGTFDENAVVNLPGANTSKTYHVAVADVDNDGRVDIIIGNLGQYNQILINAGDGTFDENAMEDLPGGALSTRSVVIADMNNDGLLDIIIGNWGTKNQFLLYSSCKNGGVRLHSKSWCLQCPSFMGQEFSICRECMPDYMQRPGTSDYQCAMNNDEKCVLGQRKLGENTCSRCPDGTYYDALLTRSTDDPSTWNDDRCIPCSPGQFVSEGFIANKCLECLPGTYQSEIGATTCLDCPSGEFQSNVGQESCDSCSIGGYCDAVNKFDGGFIPCRPGTYNDKTGQSNEDACQLCPSGTYSTISRGNSTDVCLGCSPGTYNDQPGQTKCKPCDPGTFQKYSNQTYCESCPSGTYADKSGFEKCIQCPYRLGSTKGNKMCSFCIEGFYLNNISTTDYSELSLDASKYCSECPTNADCPANSTISNLGVKQRYWRNSKKTSKLYKCRNDVICTGSSPQNGQTEEEEVDLSDNSMNKTGRYCKVNHTGPLCEVCVQSDHYFNEEAGECRECPSLSLITTKVICIISGVAVALFLVTFITMRRFSKLFGILSSISLQAKAKLLVSFYQIISSLEDVYGVKLDSQLTNWVKVFQSILSLDFLTFFNVPTSCIGSTLQQIIFGATWPYATIAMVTIGMVAFAAYSILIESRGGDQNGEEGLQQAALYRTKIISDTKKRIIEMTIVVLYFTLPTVSTSIASAIKCRAFQDDDKYPEPGSVSYLLLDMSIVCDREQSTKEFERITLTYMLFNAVWTVLTPIGFLILLVYIRQSVQSKRITFLANACRFLWQDYDPSMLFWDILDTMRKVSLVGFIMLIDIDEGSNKLLRLVVAIIVSVLYTCILLAYHPYKRHDDYNLAFVSNFLLICCFTLGIVLKLCDEEEEDGVYITGTCYTLIGLSLDSYRASLAVVVLALSMLFFTICFIIILALNKIKAPKVRMVSSGYVPNLELPKHCNFHIFMSHVWGTGQARTHAITRKLQLFFPDLKVWLDVDELQDISKLEESVAESAVFVLFYSKHYFQSKNCRREIYTAIKLDKPVILLYEGDESVLEEMQEECMNNCLGVEDGIDSPTATLILQKLLGVDNDAQNIISSMDSSIMDGPIEWLNKGSFSAAALNKIYTRVLYNLPYYKRYPNQLLDQGITVPGELGPVHLHTPINILIHASNEGCSDVVAELKAMMLVPNQTDSEDLIDILNVTSYLQDMDTQNNHVADSNEDVINDSNTSDVREEVQYNLPSSSANASTKPTFFLLYLNRYTFEGDGQDKNELASIIQSCIDDPNITIVLIHEKDVFRGGCEFADFFVKTPEELIKPPNYLFRDIAIPLYASRAYRLVSLRQIACKMGATIVTVSKIEMLKISFMNSLKKCVHIVKSRES